MTAPQNPSSGLKGKILVIDDELDIREGLYDLLPLEGGYTVELAHNGTADLHKLEGTSYDLVLLDLMMPDMSGMDVLRQVRKTDTETPIFMITAYGSVEAAVDALKLDVLPDALLQANAHLLQLATRVGRNLLIPNKAMPANAKS